MYLNHVHTLTLNLCILKKHCDAEIAIRSLCRRAKYDQENAQAELKVMLEKHKDVTPRRDFEGLQIQLQELKEQFTEKSNDTSMLHSEHE